MSSTHRYTAQRTSSSASSQQDSNVRSSAFVQVGAPSDTFNSCRMDSGIAWAGAWAGGGSSRILSSPVERRAKVERLDAASLPVEIRANIERLNAPSPSGKMPTQPRIYTTSPEPDALSSLPDWYNHHPRTTELGQAISSAGPSSTYSMSTEYRARQPIETASYRCTVEGCGKSFSRGYSLTAHMETHDEERVFPFPCQEPNCPKKFVRKTDLQRHHQSVHTMERNHMCDFCGRLFGRADTRRRHMEDECHMRFKYGEMLTFGETLTPNAEVENALLCDGDYSEVRLRDNKFDHGRKLCYGDTLSDSRTAQGTPNAEVEDALLCDGDYSRFHPWENTFDHGRKPCFGDTLSDGRTAQEAQKSDFEGGLGSLRSQSTRLSPSLLTSQSHSECSSSDSEPKILSGDEKKHLLLGRLMDYFYELFSWCHTPELAVDAAIPNAEVEENSDSVNSPTACILNNGKPSPKAHAVGGKRPRNGERDDEDDAGEENLPAKRKTLPGDATTILRKLACPYFKNDPEHCQAGRSCSGPGWATVHRMKEHLDRNHALSPMCVRCCAAFETETDRDDHMRSQEQCSVRDPPPRRNGFNASQRDQLKSRPKGYKLMSEPQKWRYVYKILFPEVDDADIPSPYYEFKTLRDAGHPADPMVEYESFLQRELPDRVRHRLEVQIEDAWMPIEEALRGQIVDIVRDVQLELFQQFRSHKVRAKSDSGEGAANCGTDAIVVAAENDDALQLSEAEIAQEGLTQQQESCEEHVQAYRPEPYLDFPLDFFGELYNFEPLIKSFGAEDSTYGTISEADKGKQQETESGQSSRYYI